MKVSILGSGFGIYGYLPAFALEGYKILVPSKSRKFVNSRIELRDYQTSIEFLSEEEELLESQVIVIARRPQDQVTFLLNNKISDKFLFLEKPIAPDYDLHHRLISYLEKENLQFSIGYIFEFVDWYSEISLIVKNQSIKNISIDWTLEKRSDDWKSHENQGGGLLKYYGLHILYLYFLLEYNFDQIEIKVSSENLELNTKKIFGPNINSHVKYGQTSEFKVSIDSKVLFKDASPFGESGVPGVQDPRVSILQKYINSRLGTENFNSSEYLSFEKNIVSKVI